MTQFQSKYGPWAMVTGASSGMGAAFARQLAERQLNLVLVARRTDRLNALAEQLQTKYAIQTRVVAADLSRDDFLPAIARATEGLDVHLLVNNAGAGVAGKFLNNDLDAEMRSLNLNCRAPLALTHHFGRTMQRRGRGGVIFLASTVAFAGMPGWSNYAATKAQNLLFAEGLAAELRRDGVDVLALCPGFTRTELLPLTGFGRLMSKKPDAAVRVALKEIGRKRRVTVGLLNKVIVLSTRFQPRRLNTWIFGVVFKWALDTRAMRAVPVVADTPAPAPEPPAPPPDVVSAEAEAVSHQVVGVPAMQDGATQEEKPDPRPARVSVAEEDDQPVASHRRRPRYTPPPRSTIRSK
jgi:short-subunit dehydrogenase